MTPATNGVIERLLFVADVAVSEVDDMPVAARAVFDAAARIHVVTPSLPGRLAWLADAVASFEPDHILVGLRSFEHATWQEHGLIERLEARYELPVTTYAVNPAGHSLTANGSLLLAYDGSEPSRCAIEQAAALFPGRDALVVSVGTVTALGSEAWAGALDSMADFVQIDRAAADGVGAIADDGVRVARAVGLCAEPLAVASAGSVSETLLREADRVDAASIVMGSRGLTGLRSVLLGSVSRAVLQKSNRPTLIVPAAHDR